MKQTKNTLTETINFEATLFNIGTWTILQLPKEASTKLPSRGMTMVEGTINGKPFQSELEPDGKGSHWVRMNKNLSDISGAVEGDTVTVSVKPSTVWPEPEIPEDLRTALKDDPKAFEIWEDITPMARWDWIRWIRSTNNSETRKGRIQKTFGKLKSGTRRPCCFNRSACTEPTVSHNGVLLDSTDAK